MYLAFINTFLFEIDSPASCRISMRSMSVVFYKYRMIIALIAGFFGVYFLFLGFRFIKFGLFSMGFLTTFFLVLTILDIIVVSFTQNQNGSLLVPPNIQ